MQKAPKSAKKSFCKRIAIIFCYQIKLLMEKENKNERSQLSTHWNNRPTIDFHENKSFES